MTRVCISLGHNVFQYTTSNDYYYPESVCDFYDRMEEDEPNGVFTVTYDGVMHPITIELIGAAMGVACGRTQEQAPNGVKALGIQYREIAPKSMMGDGYVKLDGLGKNQLLSSAWINDNIIPRDKQLNMRKAEYLYMIQKHLELRWIIHL